MGNESTDSCLDYDDGEVIAENGEHKAVDGICCCFHGCEDSGEDQQKGDLDGVSCQTIDYGATVDNLFEKMSEPEPRGIVGGEGGRCTLRKPFMSLLVTSH